MTGKIFQNSGLKLNNYVTFYILFKTPQNSESIIDIH